ncbi:Rrf2 family transcriptional regulator [Oxalobacter vibrioformis]|uniref:Rrf2 family transcriptional regulator n=1 Tax=Oxalobacter vibrioformis TaxID=933080 RepID=A0A9E9P3B8_9BURK|nr:Rrf2 family transcriptional regulator [Oxalobacter vibrioformis]NLC23039.1 Rrf2 family transcriptional regulator [Oxalobacter sp.]WAW08986.1 Rrf2 family transcriptional regulator [Oxalobacter vibrioformis]
MQLTQQTDYALRVLMYVAANPDRLVNITEISDFYQISRSHLAKIVASLGRSGYLKSIRGNNGGIRLKKQADEINIGEVVRRFEPLGILECMGKGGRCVVARNCMLKRIFIEATSRFLETIDQYHLNDLLENGMLLQQFRNR